MCVHGCRSAFSMRLDDDDDDDNEDEDEDEGEEDVDEEVIGEDGWRHRRRRRGCSARAEEEQRGWVDRRSADGVYDWNGGGG